jgi:hypothetical protein
MTLYQEIEHQIMLWGHDGTKTAGFLTRKIMKLIEEENKKEIRDIKIDLVFNEAAEEWLFESEEHNNEISFIEGAKWVLNQMNKNKS